MSKNLDRFSSLMEEVHELVASIEPNQRLEAMEAFAQMALISEKLAQSLATIAESHDESELADIAVTFENLARDAAQVAITLEGAEDKDVDHKALKEAFDEQSSYMLNGLTLFEELTEEDESDEDDDEDEEKEDEKEKKEESVNWAGIARTLAEKSELIATKLAGKSVNDDAEEEDGDAEEKHPANGPDLRDADTKKGGKRAVVR